MNMDLGRCPLCHKLTTAVSDENSGRCSCDRCHRFFNIVNLEEVVLDEDD